MAELTEDQLAKIAIIEKRGNALIAYLDQLGREETPTTPSGKVHNPEWLKIAREQAMLSILAAKRAVEAPEPSDPPVTP